MIRPLRRIHWLASIALAVTAPALLGLSFAVRRSPPVHSGPLPGFPRSSSESRDQPPAPVARSSEFGIEISTTGATPAVTIALTGPLGLPDVVAYWADGRREDLLDSALFLGPVGGSRQVSFPLPEGAAAGGSLLLYSGAIDSMVAVFHLPPWDRQ